MFSCFSAELRSLAFLTFSFILLYFSFSQIIALNFSWLISMSISAWDTKVSMLSSLLLANIRILSWFFFLFLVIFSIFFLLFLLLEKKLKQNLHLLFQMVLQQHLQTKLYKLHCLLHLKQLKSCLCNQKQ